jgi:Cu/Ag efflux protein CusF
MRSFLSAVAALALPLVAVAAAQDKSIGKAEVATITATIEAIDASTREVTLKNAKGELTTIYAGPEVQRFSELKVGDKVTMRYTEAMVAEIKSAGQAAAPGKEETNIVRGTGPQPGGTATRKMTTTVTVLAIDGKAPAVSVKTEDGRTVSFRVADASNLEGVKVGDRVQITYTQALAVSVESPK